MQIEQIGKVSVETIELYSEHLDRSVKIDFYHTDVDNKSGMSLLLINDGQDVEKMDIDNILNDASKPLLIAAIHCGLERKREYGMSVAPNADGWGDKASAYEQFIITELLPFINSRFNQYLFTETAFAGFSLGALSALDIVWNNPDVFNRVGVFSGSLWWRSVDQEDEKYDDDKHRIMHQVIRNGEYKPGLKFFFQCGNQDETHDRNNNGIIDSIDDTLDMMKELAAKGYASEDVFYMELKDGKHDVPTWGRAFPYFLKWIFGKK